MGADGVCYKEAVRNNFMKNKLQGLSSECGLFLENKDISFSVTLIIAEICRASGETSLLSLSLC